MPAANVGRRTAGEGSGHKNVFPPGCVSLRDSVVSEAGIREHKKASVVAVVLAVSVLLNYVYDILAKSNTYVGLYKRHPWYLVESIDKFAVLLLCFAALCYLYRCGLKGVLEELRLFRVPWYGIGTVVLCTMPMLVGFALTRRIDPQLSILAVAFKGLLSPIAEEVHARGFAFLQLYRRAGWPFWAAVLPQAVLSGFGHIEQGQTCGAVATYRRLRDNAPV